VRAIQGFTWSRTKNNGGALEMTRIAQELKYNLVFWSVVDGLVDTQKGTNNSANDPLEALIAIKDMKEKTLIQLRDFHQFLQDPNPILIRQLKDVLQMAKTKSKTLIILACRMVVPGTEMAKNLLNHPQVVNDSDDTHRALADLTAQRVNMPDVRGSSSGCRDGHAGRGGFPRGHSHPCAETRPRAQPAIWSPLSQKRQKQRYILCSRKDG
jgi:hypothetical protein